MSSPRPSPNASLRAPFPWFGGKGAAAPLVWERFGDVPNYVENFAGSLAVLLARPEWNAERGCWRDGRHRVETVNDLDCYITNFWRAVAANPTEVARWAEYPVSELDIHARHRWLVAQGEFRERLREDPDYFDARTAGWWVYGISAWIGRGWCCGGGTPNQRPDLADRYGRGVFAMQVRTVGVRATMQLLSARLRNVRVTCGDWSRLTSRNVLQRNRLGLTGVFLDPEYCTSQHKAGLYVSNSSSVAADVSTWATANGDNPNLRIAVCGFEGEHADLEKAGWTVVAWRNRGGYGVTADGRGRENSTRERIWFSPHCLKADAEIRDSEPTPQLFAASPVGGS